MWPEVYSLPANDQVRALLLRDWAVNQAKKKKKKKSSVLAGCTRLNARTNRSILTTVGCR